MHRKNISPFTLKKEKWDRIEKKDWYQLACNNK